MGRVNEPGGLAVLRPHAEEVPGGANTPLGTTGHRLPFVDQDLALHEEDEASP